MRSKIIFRRGAWCGRVAVAGRIRERVLATPNGAGERAKMAARREAERELVKFETEASDPQFSNRPLLAHLDDYITFLRAGGWTGATTAEWREKTKTRISRILRRSRATMLSNTDPSAIDGALLSLRGKVSESTRRKYRDALVSFGKWLVMRRRTPTNPFADLAKIKATDKRKRGWFTDEMLGRLLAAAPPERADIYRFAVLTGLRQNELRTLAEEQVSVDGDRLTIRLRAKDTKSRRDDRIVLILPGGPTVLPPFSVPENILSLFYADMEAAGIDRVDEIGRRRDFHSLRHTAARRLILAGANPKYVQRVMRHADIRLTFNLYADLEVDELLDSDPVAVPPLP